eukprot:549034-Amphidinium_carterae.1
MLTLDRSSSSYILGDDGEVYRCGWPVQHPGKEPTGTGATLRHPEEDRPPEKRVRFLTEPIELDTATKQTHEENKGKREKVQSFVRKTGEEHVQYTIQFLEGQAPLLQTQSVPISHIMKTQGQERERWKRAFQEELTTFEKQQVYERLTPEEAKKRGLN